MIKKYLSALFFFSFILSNLLYAQFQTITSSTYNASNGTLVITGTNFNVLQYVEASRIQISNGTVARPLSATVDAYPGSATTATLIVTGNDKLYLNAILDANGTSSSTGGTYNLAASAQWNGILCPADGTNPILVFNYSPPSITSSTYNASTGYLVVTGSRLAKGSGHDIDASRFTITGKASGTYTLTSGTSDAEITSETAFTLIIGGTDKTEVDKLIDDNGLTSSDNVTYNLAGANGWNAFVNADHADLTGNSITASNVNYAPVATSLRYAGSNGLDSIIIGRFTYTDPEADPPGNHLFRWYRSDDGTGVGTPIAPFIADSTYEIVAADTGKYIRYDVIPVAVTGRTPGDTASAGWLKVNLAPKASNLRFAGSNGLDSALIARFTYSDAEPDNPGAHLFRWYRSPNGIGSWEIITPIRIDSSYAILAADTGNYLRFSVTPVALTGTTPGLLRYSSAIKVNDAPKAYNLHYSGSNGLDSIIIASFTYFDAEGDLPDDPTFRWFRSPTGIGNGIPITGITPDTAYTIVSADTGQYIRFEVTPKALTGTTPGLTRQSTWLKVNAAPKATYLDYSGSNGLDSIIIASFTYFDAEGDLPDDPTFRWFRSPTGIGNGSLITGPTTDSAYTITSLDTGQYIRFEVTPKALTGTTPGFIKQSTWLKVNTAPKANSLNYSGWNGLDSTIIAAFSYIDEDSDPAGEHIYRWYWSSTGIGAGSPVKGPSTDSTYTIVPADTGNYISYEVTPVALNGTTPGITTKSPWFNINTRPRASNLIITGVLNIEDSLKISFDYSDVEGDLEGTHKYQWYVSTTSSWSFAVPIANDTLDTHHITKNEEAKFLGCIITPYALTGTVKGLQKQSILVGPVNSMPDALNPIINAPTILVGDTLTASFDYVDIDNDLPGNHIFEWYRANNASGGGRTLITGETDSIYVALPQDNNKWIAFEVKPVALTGSSPGDSVMSPWTGSIGENKPSATISGGDSLCPDGISVTQININIVGGTPPFEITYNNGQKDTIIPNLADREYNFSTNKAGLYTLVNIADKHYDTGIVSPDTVIVFVYDLIKAVLSGASKICNDKVSVAPLQVDFTAGAAPWNFTLERNPGTDTTYANIVQDPFNFFVKNIGTYRIKSISDSHCAGDTTGSGTVTVSYKESPQAMISGIDTICPGDTAYLTVVLNSGYAPWKFTYTVNGLNPTTISNITQTTYTLKVFNAGLYTLVSVEDTSCTGQTTGLGEVIYYSSPTADLSGGGLMCEGTSTNLLVELSGTAPWNYIYRLTNDYITDTIPVNNVTSEFNYIEVSPNTETFYTLIEVSDKHCKGTVSGNANVVVMAAPEVHLYGLQSAYNITSPPIPIFGDPEGGEFDGPALIEKDDTTFFLAIFAGLTEGSPHAISYKWQEPGTACWGWDTSFVKVIEAEASIDFPDNKKFYCYNDDPFIVTGVNLVEDTGTFAILGGTGLIDNGDNTATVYPAQLHDGEHTIIYTYFNDTYIDVEDKFELQYVYNISIIGFSEHIFCSNDEPVELNGNVSEGIFYGNSVSGNTATGFYFVPEIAETGVDTIFYSYTTPEGCTRVTFDTALINEAPVINFTVDDLCITIGTNDYTTFTNNSTATDPIISWLWNFGDVASGEENTSTLMNPAHTFTNSGPRQIKLTASTVKGCSATEDSIFNFGDNPSIDFRWESECFVDGIPISFIDNSTCNEGIITDYQWKFYHTGGYTLSSEKDAEHIYSDYGDYNVELTAESEYGCINTDNKVIHLRPTKILTEEESYYEDFNDGASSWVAGYVNDENFSTNSWAFGIPNSAFVGDPPLSNIWYTNIGTSSPKEQSWVTSPCFDFRYLKKPMIKLNIWRAFDETRDGAILQYTYDNGETWQTLGDIEDGIYWYNDYNILGRPGDDNIGWSNINDNNWIEARHKLDILKGKTNVQFRVAYGSDGAAINNDGIAFDNISIENRQKIALIEHFTNYSDSACKASDSILNNIVNNVMDAVDLHFHMPYPVDDPFYEHSENIVDARKLYYGLGNYDVPYSLLDGGYNSEHIFNYDGESNTLEGTHVDIESLMDPDFKIELVTQNNGSSIDIKATLTALKEINNKSLKLHIVIIEREITQITGEGAEEKYESIVKTMLPTVAGTYYDRNWAQGEADEVNYSWTFENVFDADEIRVVGFVQDDNNLDVYQTAIDSMDYISSIKNAIHLPQDMKFIVFPNPSYGTAYIKFNQPVDNECRLELFNSTGNMAYSAKVFKGTELTGFNTTNLQNGLYILRIIDSEKVISTKKLIISH